MNMAAGRILNMKNSVMVGNIFSTEEFNAWMEKNNLQWAIRSMDEDDFNLDADGPDISAWEPERPEGEGWFIGSIHDTEDGPVCVWLRNKAEA
ncbi:putative prophage protein [Escherichia coli]|nr:putative prophage protein [Escherichia coli]